MAANPLPLLAAAAVAFYLMKKKDDEAIVIKPKPADELPAPDANANGNGSTEPDDAAPDAEDEHPGWSDYGDGTIDIVEQRDFADLDGSNPVEFRPNKEGEGVLISDIDQSWTYEMRFPVDQQGQESDFAEIHYNDGDLIWVSTAGARPLEELKLEGIPDPDQPNQRVLLAWM